MDEPSPRLTRRDLFRLALVAGPAALVAACGWDGGPRSSRARSVLPDQRLGGEKILFLRIVWRSEYPMPPEHVPETFRPTRSRDHAPAPLRSGRTGR